MSDNLGPLRRAMNDLAEHGGSTDLYERSLRRSRQLQRRTAIASGAAAAAVVFGIGGAVAFTVVDRAAPPAPVATRPPVVGVVPTSATPSAAPSLAPSSTPPSRPPSSTPSSNRPQYPDCPSAKTLERLADLPDGWSFPSSGVQCWRAWATAEPKSPTAGDGIYLFQYKPGTGWRYHSQGSGYLCADLGITSGRPPFCQME